MTQKFANAARAYLASTVSDSATTVTIDGGGSLFPAITSPEFSRAVLQDANGIEVVLITAHTANSDSFTVTRGQEGTTARSFAAGSVFGIRMTAADGDTFVAKVSGPGSATDSALAAFDGTTGKLVKQAATVTVAQGGTGATTLTANNVLLGNGTSAVQVVAPGTSGNVLTSDGTTWASSTPAAAFSTSADNTFTGTQTFSGTTAKLSVVLNDAAEVATVSATAATGTINYDITTQSVLYYTSNASANWTVNFRASSGTSLNTALATGQSVTVAFLVTQGSTAYYNSAVQVDGTTSGVTTRWLGGAPTAGNASGIDSYRYLIIKTGSATFTVLASVTQFKA